MNFIFWRMLPVLPFEIFWVFFKIAKKRNSCFFKLAKNEIHVFWGFSACIKWNSCFFKFLKLAKVFLIDRREKVWWHSPFPASRRQSSYILCPSRWLAEQFAQLPSVRDISPQDTSNYNHFESSKISRKTLLQNRNISLKRYGDIEFHVLQA